MLVAFSSCRKSSTEIVEDKFREYVYQNFDDPKDLVEILSVEPMDTVSYEKLKGILDMLYEIADNFDSLSHKNDSTVYMISDKLTNDTFVRNMSQSSKKFFDGWLFDSYEVIQEYIVWMKTYEFERIDLRIEMDSLLETNKNVLQYEYLIKTRIKEKEDLKIKKFYAIVDSVGTRFFTEPSFENYSENVYKLYKASRRYEDLTMQKKDIVLRRVELYKQALIVINSEE